MELDPIPAVVGVSPAAVAADYAHQSHLSPAETHLAASKAEEEETPEQRAAAGDPIAIAEVAQQEHRLTPVRSQALQPAHAPGAHEPGKGALIDVYD